MSERKATPTTAEQSEQQRRLVLSEEEYTLHLSTIIQRDFFPDLADLERQAALLDRRSRGDITGAVAVRRAARRLQQHEEALAEQEEEDEHDLTNDNNGTRKRPRPLPRETLTGFHARATNEDDQEFDSNQKEQVQANRERLEQLFRPTDAAKAPMLLQASDLFQVTSNRIAASEWNKPNVRNGLFFVPTPQRMPTNDHDQGVVESSTTITTTNNSNRSDQNYNEQQALLRIMPPPSNVQKGVEESSNSVQNQQQQQLVAIGLPKKQTLVEYIPKHALEKKIEPSQTRFPTTKIVPFAFAKRALIAVPPDESESDFDNGGGSTTDASTDLDASSSLPIHVERRARAKRQLREQETFVNMTPLILPGGVGNESPLMTWGTVDSTPIVLSGREVQVNGNDNDTGEYEKSDALSFSLPAETGRDHAAQKAQMQLERRAKRTKYTATSSKAKRQEAAYGRNESVSASTASLTPAAMSLFEKTKTTTPSRSQDAFASALRRSYTPKSRAASCSSSSSSRRTSRDHAYNTTPLASRHERAIAPTGKQTIKTRKN
jgi:protein DGCR14